MRLLLRFRPPRCNSSKPLFSLLLLPLPLPLPPPRPLCFCTEPSLGPRLPPSTKMPGKHQFASFLVWDSYYMSGQMEAWLLERCSENLYFAHALEFSLRASCLPAATAAPATATGASSLSSSATPLGGEGVGGGGAAAAAATAAAAAGAEIGRVSSSPGRPAAARRSSSGVDLSMGGGGDGRDPGGGEEEEVGRGGAAIDRVGRRAVELLLEEIAENGERAARRLVDEAKAAAAAAATAATASASTDVRGDGGGGGDGGLDSAELVIGSAAVAGAEDNSSSGGKEPARIGGVVDSAVGGGGGAAGGDEGEKQALPKPLYRQTLDFLDRLTDIASSLTPLSRSERTPLLREQLEEVGKKFLGARTTTAVTAAAGGGGGGCSGGGGGDSLIYVPVAGRHHRVVAVHPSESFAFSTRERAPCFVCLEVVGAKEPALLRRRRRGARRQRQWSDVSDAVEDEEVDRGGGGAGGGNMLTRRMQALRQWLPSGVSFQQTFRLAGSKGAGGGKGWRLFVGTDEPESGDSPERREKEGVLEDLEQGGSGRKRDGGSGGSGGGRASAGEEGEDRRRGERYDSDAGQYRLLPAEGEPASGASDASEWWAASTSGTGRPWGGEDDVGDNALADLPERRRQTSAPAEVGARRRGEDRGGGRQASRASAGSGENAAAGAGPTAGGERQGAEKDAGNGGEAGDGEGGDGSGGGGGGGGGAPQPQVLFNELWQDKSNRIRRASPWSGEHGWRLLPVIVKSNDDLRQEQLASQLLFVMQRILRAEGVGAWLRPYDIVALSADTGIIEAVPDTISLDALRRYRRRGAGRGGGGGESARDGGTDPSSGATRFRWAIKETLGNLGASFLGGG